MANPALVMMLLSTALSTAQGIRTQRKQQSAIDDAAWDRMRTQDQASSVINDAVQQFDPTQRQANQDQYEQEKVVYLDSILSKGRETGQGGMRDSVTGNVSNDYVMAKGNAMQSQMERASAMAKLLGKTQAPLALRQQESFGMGNLASDLSQINRQGNDQAAMNGLRINQAGQSNPLIDSVSSALMGYGQGQAMNGSVSPQATQQGNGFWSQGGTNYLTDGQGFTNNMSRYGLK